MIFVTVGTGNTYGFDRLIKKMDEISGKINEEVIMQIGCTEYRPKNAKFFVFIEKDNLKELCNNSRIIVCHSGIGSILTAMSFNKPTVIVPRRKEHNEHVDNHQMDIAKEMDKGKLITVVYDVNKLEAVLADFPSIIVPKIKTESKLTEMLHLYFDKVYFNTCKNELEPTIK